MNGINATYRNGQIVLDEPVDWPEGKRLRVEPVTEEETVGIREEDWPTDPEGIARHLALMDRIEPLEMTPEEEAEWQAARKAQKEYEIATWEERCRKIERLFEGDAIFSTPGLPAITSTVATASRNEPARKWLGATGSVSGCRSWPSCTSASKGVSPETGTSNDCAWPCPR
jgi:hypothetical protein